MSWETTDASCNRENSSQVSKTTETPHNEVRPTLQHCSSERLEISLLGNCKNVSEQGRKQTVPKLALLWSGKGSGSFQEILANLYHPAGLINFNIITRLPLKSVLMNSAHTSPPLFSSPLCVHLQFLWESLVWFLVFFF